MRRAIPDKYRGWTVKVENGTYVTEYQQWPGGAHKDSDWCTEFIVERCVSYDVVQNEWTLLFYSKGSKVPLVLPELELGAEHDPEGHGAAANRPGQADVKKLAPTSRRPARRTIFVFGSSANDKSLRSGWCWVWYSNDCLSLKIWVFDKHHEITNRSSFVMWMVYRSTMIPARRNKMVCLHWSSAHNWLLNDFLKMTMLVLLQ